MKRRVQGSMTVEAAFLYPYLLSITFLLVWLTIGQYEAARRYGGAGVMFTCLVEGRESHLYYEENNRWFVERKGE